MTVRRASIPVWQWSTQRLGGGWCTFCSEHGACTVKKALMTKISRRLGQISDIDLRLLKVFCAVVENGGISAAEISLGISRSTISTHLRELEGRLNMVLCQRGRSGFRLTQQGREVYGLTVDFLQELDTFRRRVNGVSDTLSGKLTVAMVDNVIWENDHVLQKTFEEFSRVGAKVELTVRLMSPDEIERSLLDKSVDVGILTALHTLPGLAYEDVYAEENHLYCGRGNALFDLDDDAISDQLLRDTSYVNKGYVVPEFLEETDRRMNVRATAYDVESIAFLILSGAYIGFLPRTYADNWTRDGRMRAILPERYATCFDVVAATAKGRHATEALDSFMAILREQKDAAGRAAGSTGNPAFCQT
jgi:DNA-binding transcriptional LysR family regulator